MVQLNALNNKTQSAQFRAHDVGSQMYQYIFENAPIGIIYYNEAGEITTCNDHFVDIIGSTRKLLIGQNLTRLPDPNIREAVGKALDGEVSVFEGEYHTITSNRKIAIRVEFHPLQEERGRKTGIGMIQDISERFYTTQRLKESEERYRTIFTRNHNVMLLIDWDTGYIKDANPAAVKFYGWDKEQLQDMKISEINILTSEEVNAEMQKARDEEKNFFHFKHQTADGSVKDVEVYSGLVKIDGQMYLYSIVHDITDRLTYERELNKFKLGIERSSNIVFVTDIKGEIEYVNPSFTREYGYTLDEVKGQTPRIIKSGKQGPRFYKKFWKTIVDGKIMEGELINKTKDGKLLDIRFSSNPIINSEGKKLGYIAIQENITDRKKKDNQLKESLREKEVLLAEIHHRVKNNLAIISALLELNLYQEEKESTEEFIKNSQLRIKAMANVHEMLYQSETFSMIPFRNYIQNLLHSITSSVTVDQTKPNFILDIDEVELNINQAIPTGLIMNELIINSLKHAFKGQNEPEIKVAFKNLSSQVRFSVEDNGVGVSDDVNLHESNSLGMTLIKTLADQLNAELKMENISGGFKTTVTFETNVELSGASATLV